jgi:hypothetical protein
MEKMKQEKDAEEEAVRTQIKGKYRRTMEKNLIQM